MKNEISSFNFKPGQVLGKKYKVIEQLGLGWEGEVYKISELTTGIERAAKFFYPHRNIKNKALKFQAHKTHKLRHCDILVLYNTIESIKIKGTDVFYLVSEFVEGITLSNFIQSKPGKRLRAFEAIHLLYHLSKGIAQIHQAGDYHGDLHADNVILAHYGIEQKLRVFDPFHWSDTKRENILDDVVSMIHIFYEALGGSKHYAKQNAIVKSIVCGLKKSLIHKKFKNAQQLSLFLSNLNLLECFD